MSHPLKYLSSYSPTIQAQCIKLLEADTLKRYLLNKYPTCHQFTTDKSLRKYVIELKNQFMKSTKPLSQIKYDDKIHIINNALGLHSFVSKVQGSKIKGKNEIRVSSLFKKAPEHFLKMIVVHELAHLKEKDHNKSFYKLCQHMQPDYHQIELDLRLYLTQLELKGSIYPL
tara:strand:+ start:146 stop:658 length:513 start_codon:yes stop_codon:yes gene_type:complete